MKKSTRRNFLKYLTGTALAGMMMPSRATNGMTERTRPSMPADNNQSITLFLCGDVMTGRGIDQILPHSVHPRLHEPYVRNARAYINLAEHHAGPIPAPVDHDYIWGDALAMLQNFKPVARIINLETAVTTSNDFWPDKSIHYRMHPANIACLEAAGIDCCVLANNHVLDWGYAGLEQTLQVLQSAGIKTAGAGSLKQATEPAGLDIPGGRILVFAYGHPSSGIPSEWHATAGQSGVNLITDFSDDEVEKVARMIEYARRPGDRVVVSIHWGGNWGYQVSLEQQRFARALIDKAGVDLVHGHSSHHPKGIEIHNNRLILYGCGDFINDYEGIDGHEEYRSGLTFMYFPTLDQRNGELLSLQLVPLRIEKFRLQHATDEEAKWLAAMLGRESTNLGQEPVPAEDNIIAIQHRQRPG